MANKEHSAILTDLSPEEFFGRKAEVDTLVAHVERSVRGNGCMRIAHGPGFGASEFLKQAYETVFRERIGPIPVYFAVRRADQTAARCAARFLYQYLVQAAAYLQNDPRIIAYAPKLDAIRGLAPPADRKWVERLAVFIRSSEIAGADQSFVESSFGAAVQASDAARALFLIDDVTEAQYLADGETLIDALAHAAERINGVIAFAELRRSHLPIPATHHMELSQLAHDDSCRMIEALAERNDIALSEHARDLIATQMDGRPARSAGFLRAAATRKIELNTFRGVQSIYTDEVIGGNIARYFHGVIADAAGALDAEKTIVGTLQELHRLGAEGLPMELWKTRSGLGRDAERGLATLNVHEFLRLSCGRIAAAEDDTALADYIDIRTRLQIGGGNRALVVGDSLNESLKRAPSLLAEFYQRNSGAGLRELLSSFDSSEVPAALLDHSIFKAAYGGLPDDEIIALIAKETETVHLPQMVQVVHTESLYKPIAQVTGRERSVVGRGFTAKRYSDEEEIAWIAAEVDSKLAASRELAEFWCDRLEMVALVCGFARYRIWLIAPEGFSEEAMDTLRARNAIGSNRRQITFLRHHLNGVSTETGSKPLELEMVVPMGGETELIAARAVEELAKQYDLDPKTINQIKTALIEACINATEHSGSPDRKIYQKFTLDPEKMTITISNRGLRLTDRRPAGDEPTEGRRGWGLALMRRLMDEVSIEDVEDGTSILMTKYLTARA